MVTEQSQSIDFRIPSNLNELAKYIGIEETLLKRKIQPRSEIALFQQHEIPKRGSKHSDEYRTVWEATPELADSYKSFARRFDLFARFVEPRYPHARAYGYVRGRSTLDNAKDHCGAKLIIHADIQDFFPSIQREKIKELFVRLGIHNESAEILSNYVTINNILPLGLHPSPLLANLICIDLDNKMETLAKKYECTYTRYADDMTISGNNRTPEKNEIITVLNEEGFSLSERKFYTSKPGQAHYVTGLSVTDSSPRIPRAMKRHLRQELYYCKKFGIQEHIDRIDIEKSSNYQQKGINRIDGTVRYISHVEKKSLSELPKNWAEMLTDQGLQVSYETVYDRKARIFSFFIDECEIKYQGKDLLALCLCRVEGDDFNKVSATTIQTLREHIADPFAGGNKKALQKNGLHHSDANEDLRAKYISKLATFPIRSYVVYGEIKTPEDYSETYISLLKKILPHRLMACDRSITELIFEENSKIKKEAIQKNVNDVFLNLKANNNRHPIVVTAKIGKKAEHPCFSVPDFLLAVFSTYATLETANNIGDRKLLFFESLRDKYRVILDADTNIAYSRKRPFISWP